MASRLPTVGGDNNNWGTVLNDYLQQALSSTGQLVTAATNPYTGLANTNLASTGTPGLVQLAGDLAGTAASPALASVVTAATVGSATAIPVVTYDAKGRITSTTTAAPASATTLAQGTVQLAGDLAGTATSPALANIVTAGSTGGANAIPIITYDAKGRITAASSSTLPSYGLSANFTTTSSTAAATNFSFAALANSIWTVEFRLTVQCSSTGGVKFAIQAPAATVLEGGVVGPGATVGTTIVNNRLTAINTLTTTATNTQATSPGPVQIWATLKLSTTAGNIVLAAASGTNGQTTTIFADSFMSAQQATLV